MNIKLILFIITLIIVAGVYMIRKDFPYDIEVVPVNNGLWIVNITDWADKDCYVIVESEFGQKKALLSAVKGHVKIDDLKNSTPYSLTIYRHDILGRIKYRSLVKRSSPRNEADKYIVLVGASVGKTWDLPGLPEREKDFRVAYGYRGQYAFDKSNIIKKLVDSPLKPDAVIIKECAAYFPRDTNPSIDMIKKWITILNNSGIQPILATVVPVTKEHDVDRNSSRMESINSFNVSIRKYSIDNCIPLLDLQEILSNKAGGYLDERFALPDGLHLNEETYHKHLDIFLYNFINKLFFNNPQK